MKSKVFIGSSREGLHIANAIHSNLTRDAECTVWDKGVFQLTSNTLSELIRALRDSDFGIFVFSPDDVSVMRGNTNTVARDNVLFELGLFIGRLGAERSFFLVPDNAVDLRLPSDLAGITPGYYEGSRSDGNWMAALTPACMQIQMQINRLKSFQDVPLPAGMGTGNSAAICGVASGKIYMEQYKKSYLIRGDTLPIKERLKDWASWNGALDAWVLPQSKKAKFELEFSDVLLNS